MTTIYKNHALLSADMLNLWNDETNTDICIQIRQSFVTYPKTKDQIEIKAHQILLKARFPILTLLRMSLMVTYRWITSRTGMFIICELNVL